MTVEPVLNGVALARLEKLGGTALVRQMIELYLANGPERIRALQEGVEAGDATRIERAAHTMKSSAGNLGATKLQHTADALESVAATGAIDTGMVERLVAEYEESEQALIEALKDLEQ